MFPCGNGYASETTLHMYIYVGTSKGKIFQKLQESFFDQ